MRERHGDWETRRCETASYSFWRAGGLILRGWARVALADHALNAETGLEEICGGLKPGSKPAAARSNFVGVYAEALQRINRWDDAIAPLELAITCAGTLPEGLYEAQLHRLLGRSRQMASESGPSPEARRAFETAESIARNQGARLFELQASAELALLQQPVPQRQRKQLIAT